jgi:hypothetical protein
MFEDSESFTDLYVFIIAGVEPGRTYVSTEVTVLTTTRNCLVIVSVQCMRESCAISTQPPYSLYGEHRM